MEEKPTVERRSEREVVQPLDEEAIDEPRMRGRKLAVDPYSNKIVATSEPLSKVVNIASLGQLALRVAEKSYTRLEYRLDTGHRFTNPELSLQGASSVKSGMELLAKPVNNAEPDWGQINVQVNVAPGATVTASAKRKWIIPP